MTQIAFVHVCYAVCMSVHKYTVDMHRIHRMRVCAQDTIDICIEIHRSVKKILNIYNLPCT